MGEICYQSFTSSRRPSASRAVQQNDLRLIKCHSCQEPNRFLLATPQRRPKNHFEFAPISVTVHPSRICHKLQILRLYPVAAIYRVYHSSFIVSPLPSPLTPPTQSQISLFARTLLTAITTMLSRPKLPFLLHGKISKGKFGGNYLAQKPCFSREFFAPTFPSKERAFVLRHSYLS